MESCIEKYDEPNPNEEIMSVFRHAMYKPSEEKILKRIRLYINQSNRKLFVYKIEGKIIGCIAYSIQDKQMEIENIGISIDHRKKGIGKSLVYEMVRIENPIRIYAETDNESVGFYRSIGFVITLLGKKYENTDRYNCEMITKGRAPALRA